MQERGTRARDTPERTLFKGEVEPECRTEKTPAKAFEGVRKISDSQVGSRKKMAAEYTANPAPPPNPAAASLGERLCFCWRESLGTVCCGQGREKKVAVTKLLSYYPHFLPSPTAEEGTTARSVQGHCLYILNTTFWLSALTFPKASF